MVIELVVVLDFVQLEQTSLVFVVVLVLVVLLHVLAQLEQTLVVMEMVVVHQVA